MASYNYMMSADEVAQELNCSKSHAYKLVKAMNKELSAQGYITMAGRIWNAKRELEIDSVKRGKQWYWMLPE